MSTQDAGQEQLILDMVDRFLEKEVKPYAWQLEHDDEYPAEIVEKMNNHKDKSNNGNQNLSQRGNAGNAGNVGNAVNTSTSSIIHNNNTKT